MCEVAWVSLPKHAAGPAIVIFTTGGTIDKVYFDSKGGYEVGASVVRGFLANACVGTSVDVFELLRKDSLDMTAANREVIRDAVAKVSCSRVIITHGTDTMVDTARLLLSISDKTIVLTGALQPGRFVDSDAPFNLGMAVAAVQALPPGVYVAANGLILPAAVARKNRELNRFELETP